MSPLPDPLNVLCVCGVGMGSSLILHMTVETALNRMGINANIDHTDISSAHGSTPDVVVGQAMHVDEVQGIAPVSISLDDFIDDIAAEERLTKAFTEAGWLP